MVDHLEEHWTFALMSTAVLKLSCFSIFFSQKTGQVFLKLITRKKNPQGNELVLVLLTSKTLQPFRSGAHPASGWAVWALHVSEMQGSDFPWKPSWTWWTQTLKNHTSHMLSENLFSPSNHHKMIHSSHTHQKVHAFFPQRDTANT